MRHLFGPFLTGRAAAGLLIFRLVFGLGIASHGFQKATSHGYDHLGTGWLTWFEPAGSIPMPLQGLATLAELAGGLGIMVGFITPLAAFGVFFAMTFAMFKVHLPAHEVYVSLTGGPNYEMCLHYLIFGLVVLITGPGVVSLDYLFFGRRWRRTNPYAP